MPSLPDIAKDLTANSGLSRLLAGHDPGGRRNDRDPKPTKHPRNLPLLHVHPQARLAHALDPCQYRILPARIAQVELENVAAALGVDPVVAYEAFFLEDVGDRDLDLGGRH